MAKGRRGAAEPGDEHVAEADVARRAPRKKRTLAGHRPVRPAPRPDAPVTGPVNRAQTGQAPSYRTTTGPRTGFLAEARLATGRPDP